MLKVFQIRLIKCIVCFKIVSGSGRLCSQSKVRKLDFCNRGVV